MGWPGSDVRLRILCNKGRVGGEMEREYAVRKILVILSEESDQFYGAGTWREELHDRFLFEHVYSWRTAISRLLDLEFDAAVVDSDMPIRYLYYLSSILRSLFSNLPLVVLTRRWPDDLAALAFLRTTTAFVYNPKLNSQDVFQALSLAGNKARRQVRAG